MTRLCSLLTAVALLLGLSGCCPNGCFVLSGEAYRKLAYPPPLVNDWVKDGVTVGERKVDWEKCGGFRTGNFSPHDWQIDAERRSKEEDFIDIHDRIYRNLQRCMRRNGYRYAGKCYDNDISRSMPACGAP